MKVRPYLPEDCSVLARLFAETVRRINAADYSPEQIRAWASNPPDVGHWCSQVQGRLAFVAEANSEITGFATAEPSGHLDHLYVHHEFQRQGTASALLRRVEREAILGGLHRVFTEASITAVPFFESAGFRIISAQIVAVSGIPFRNYRMEKLLIKSTSDSSGQ